MNTDLFPQTLLVSRDGERVYTTSLKVAEHFQKAHYNVLRDIEKLQADYAEVGLSALSFEATSYKTHQSKPRPMYVMDRKAFSILAMRFTGKKALVWRDDFYNAFEAMEAELHRLHTAKAHALDMLRPNLQAVIDGERVGANRALLARYMGKTVGSVTYHRCVARRLGLIGQRQGAQA